MHGKLGTQSVASLIFIVPAIFVFSVSAGQTQVQSAATSNVPQPEAILVKLSPPVYPILARQVGIQGDMDLKLGIRHDGTVDSAEVLSGPAFLVLRHAAVESALHSQFECRDCDGPVTFFHVIYTFRLAPAEPCGTSAQKQISATPPQDPKVTRSGNHVTVLSQPINECTDDPIVEVRRVRSAKCLWLWRCGTLSAIK